MRASGGFPSFLQPRVSPMGCDGIRYSVNMQPKSGVQLSRPKTRDLELVQRCSRKQPATKFMVVGKNQRLFNCRWSKLSVQLRSCFCIRKKTKTKQKKVRACSLAVMTSEREEGKILSVPSPSCPGADLRSTFQNLSALAPQAGK